MLRAYANAGSLCGSRTRTALAGSSHHVHSTYLHGPWRMHCTVPRVLACHGARLGGAAMHLCGVPLFNVTRIAARTRLRSGAALQLRCRALAPAQPGRAPLSQTRWHSTRDLLVDETRPSRIHAATSESPVPCVARSAGPCTSASYRSRCQIAHVLRAQMRRAPQVTVYLLYRSPLPRPAQRCPAASVDPIPPWQRHRSSLQSLVHFTHEGPHPLCIWAACWPLSAPCRP